MTYSIMFNHRSVSLHSLAHDGSLMTLEHLDLIAVTVTLTLSKVDL